MGVGLDAIVAKRADLPYRSGERTGMKKIKAQRTADCVVGGFRYLEKKPLVGSLLLGLYKEGRTRSRWIHLVHPCRGSPGPDAKAEKADKSTGIHRQGSRWTEPLEHEAFHGVGAARQ
jgi:ATP-dependent DNA ligase